MNESSIFLLENSSNKYKFSDKPPAIFVDTCFWNEAYGIGAATYRANCKEFINYCVSNEILLCTSSVVFGEIQHLTKQAFLKKYAKDHNIQIPKYYNHQNNYKSLYESLLEKDQSIYEMLDNEINKITNSIRKYSIDLNYEGNDSFTKQINDIQKSTKYIIGERDAENVAIYHNNGINSVATIDGDYWKLDNQNIYTVPNQEFQVRMLGRKNTLLEYDENLY